MSKEIKEEIKRKFEIVSEIEDLGRYASMNHNDPKTIHFEVRSHYGKCGDSQKILIDPRHNERLKLELDKIVKELELEIGLSDINIHGVDLSILNEEDWFYVETQLFRWIAKGNIYTEKSEKAIHYNLITYDFWGSSSYLCEKDDIILIRKATPEDLEPFFKKHPMYDESAKVGDVGIFYDRVELKVEELKQGFMTIDIMSGVDDNGGFICSYGVHWDHFFKVYPTETIQQIKERFLKQHNTEK